MNLSDSEMEFLADYIVESEAIENIERSREEVLAELMLGKTDGHVGAYLYLFAAHKRGEMISGKMIRHVQGLIVSEQPKFGARTLHSSQIGKWRKVGVSVGGRQCPHSSTVPGLMKQFVADVRHMQKHIWQTMTAKENVCFTASAHFAYLHIHPFVDGNGRSSRAISYFLYRHTNLSPFLFTARDRHVTYYQCFEEPKDMMGYFLERTNLSVSAR